MKWRDMDTLMYLRTFYKIIGLLMNFTMSYDTYENGDGEANDSSLWRHGLGFYMHSPEMTMSSRSVELIDSENHVHSIA